MKGGGEPKMRRGGEKRGKTKLVGWRVAVIGGRKLLTRFSCAASVGLVKLDLYVALWQD